MKRFIYSSSIEAVGGSKTGEPLTEDARCNPFGIYGKTKRLAELITLEYFQEYNMPNCILRFVMTYGPRSTLLWPRLFNLVRKGFYPVIGDGNTKWEFCYVGNEVEGMIKAAETKKKYRWGFFFISDERSYTIKEILTTIARVMNIKFRIIYIPPLLAYPFAISFEALSKVFKFYPFAVSETGRPAFSRKTIKTMSESTWICDITKARKILNYNPPFSLKEGIRITIDWFKK